MGYGDYQNGQQGILNSLAIEFDVYQDVSMNYPNANHGVHSRGNSPNSSNESAVILGLVTIPAIQTGNGTRHTVFIEYQAAPNILEVLLDGHLLCSENFKLTDWIELPRLEVVSSESQLVAIMKITFNWSFWQLNGTDVSS